MRGAAFRLLLTLMVSGRNDSYQAVSCHLGYSKSERQLSLLPEGEIRPNAAVELRRKLSFNVGRNVRRSAAEGTKLLSSLASH